MKMVFFYSSEYSSHRPHIHNNPRRRRFHGLEGNWWSAERTRIGRQISEINYFPIPTYTLYLFTSSMTSLWTSLMYSPNKFHLPKFQPCKSPSPCWSTKSHKEFQYYQLSCENLWRCVFSSGEFNPHKNHVLNEMLAKLEYCPAFCFVREQSTYFVRSFYSSVIEASYTWSSSDRKNPFAESLQ